MNGHDYKSNELRRRLGHAAQELAHETYRWNCIGKTLLDSYAG